MNLMQLQEQVLLVKYRVIYKTVKDQIPVQAPSIAAHDYWKN